MEYNKQENLDSNIEQSNLFSKLAFACAYAFFLVPTFCFTFWPPKVKVESMVAMPSFINDFINIVVVGSFILGIIFSIISFRRKEKFNHFKTFAIITISTIIILMMISNAIDIYNTLND